MAYGVTWDLPHHPLAATMSLLSPKPHIYSLILTFVIGVTDVLSLVDLKLLVVTTDINVVDLIDILGVDALRC